ncbi:hypothetical protein [uncultured Acetatifactor sp.]|uniref:hypothetical protein n=1 Tax=uncultured Acetatifactor sp. TaxID=1671927 RepID=UPI0026189E8C|nr:hypothetical protein [uncultured Acetatifactor sp.]
MTPEEIAVKIEGHEHEIKSLKHRMDTQEESKSIQQLVVSVERIALSTEHIMQEQEQQSKRLEKIEGRDGEKWRKAMSYIGTAILGAVLAIVFSRIGI